MNDITVWHIKVYVKTWYSSKNFMNFVWFFRIKHPNTPRPKCVNSFCEYLNNLAQKVIHEDLIGSKYPNTMYITDTSRPKVLDFSCKQNIIWEYLDILTQKIMQKYLL